MKKILPLLLFAVLFFQSPSSVFAIKSCSPPPSPGTPPSGHYINGGHPDIDCAGLCEWPDPTGLAQPTPQFNCYVQAGTTPPPSPTGGEPCPSGNCRTGLGIDIPTKPDKFVTAFFAILLSLSGGVALMIIMISGYRMMASKGNPEKIEGARETLISAITGLLFTIFSMVALQVIGYNILRIPGFGQ